MSSQSGALTSPVGVTRKALRLLLGAGIGALVVAPLPGACAAEEPGIVVPFARELQATWIHLPERPSCVYTLSELAKVVSTQTHKEIIVDARHAGRRLLVVSPVAGTGAVPLLELAATATGLKWREVGGIAFLTDTVEAKLAEATREAREKARSYDQQILGFLFGTAGQHLQGLTEGQFLVGRRTWNSMPAEARQEFIRLALAAPEATARPALRQLLETPGQLDGADVEYHVIAIVGARSKRYGMDLGQVYNVLKLWRGDDAAEGSTAARRE